MLETVLSHLKTTSFKTMFMLNIGDYAILNIKSFFQSTVTHKSTQKYSTSGFDTNHFGPYLYRERALLFLGWRFFLSLVLMGCVLAQFLVVHSNHCHIWPSWFTGSHRSGVYWWGLRSVRGYSAVC